MIISSSDLWIDLAIDDLNSSRILYATKSFRNSYFLFQQSVEKANKAFGLKSGLLKVKDLEDVRHDQFKMYRRYAVKQRDRFNSKLGADLLPARGKENATAFSEMISVIDSLRDMNLLALGESDLHDLLGLKDQIRISDELIEKVKEMDIDLDNEVMSLITKLMLWMNDNMFIMIRLIICAFVTIKHSSKTRYPTADHNPITFYTAEHPLMKVQPTFMKSLEEALSKLKTFEKLKY